MVIPKADFESTMNSAISTFYEADWSETERLLNLLKQADPTDTRIYFFEAMLPFWAYFFGGNESQKAKEFMDLSASAIKIGENRLAVNDKDTSVVLLLSGLHGYRSLVAASERQFRTAISSGATGYSYTKVLLSLDNNDPNTLMGQGVFQYMVGAIPAEIRWMARLAGLSGDKETGYRMLEEAASSDSYVSNDAHMFLAYFYERDNKLDKALYHLETLAAKYPTNTIFLYNIARIFESKDDLENAYLTYNEILSLSSDAVPVLHQISEKRLQELSLLIESQKYRTVGYP